MAVFELDSSMSVEETMIALRKSAEAARWSVLQAYDFSEILASKGFKQPGQIRTLEICNARHANDMLSLDPHVAMFMPCTLMVYSRGSIVSVAVIEPNEAIPMVLGDESGRLGVRSQEISEELRKIVENALIPE